MGVYKRGRVYWYEFWHKGIRHRESTGCTSKREAEDIEREARRTARLGTGATTRLSLSEAAEFWFDEHARHLKSWQTIAFNLKACARVMDFTLDVSEIDTATIGAAMTARRAETTHNKRPPSNSTINREIIDTLRPILTFARKRKRATVQVIDWEDLRLAEPRQRYYEFTTKERAAVVATLLPHHRLILAFLARYGVRLKEAWFPLRALDLETGWVMLRKRKGGIPHEIQLIASDLTLMQERSRRAAEAGLDTVWFREGKGGISAVPPSTFQTAMKRAYKRVGIEGARAAHDWRHFAGTEFLRATGDLAAAQRLLGHSDIATTRRYARPHRDAVTGHLERMAAESTPHKITHNEGAGDRVGNADVTEGDGK